MLNNYYEDLVNSLHDSKLVNKLIATIKISKIIEYGFGGLVNTDDIENNMCMQLNQNMIQIV